MTLRITDQRAKPQEQKYLGDLIGRTVTGIKVTEDIIRLTFDGQFETNYLEITDEQQSCCEHRYISTDDDPQSILLGALVSIEAKEEGPDVDDSEDFDGDAHDAMFLEIVTTKGSITCVTHNVHNGYYGGFDLHIRVF